MARFRPPVIVGGVLALFLLLDFRGMWDLQSFTTSGATTWVAPSQKVVHVQNNMNTTRVGIVVVADQDFQSLQEPLYKTLRCYAARHGYECFILEPSSSCRQVLHDFFFQKHCTVREFLSKRPPSYTLFVVDGDVIAAAPEVSLSRWIEQDADVLLYEREWNFEITAGNYMVRNTQFGLSFLLAWEQFDYRARSIKGFHSFDNGAIHLVVLQVLGIPVEDYIECDRRYQMLTNRDVKHLDEYYRFVACTRRALGPNRRWNIKGTGVLVVAHRYHGFAVDHFIARRKPGGGIPFYHGEKNPEEAVKRYNNTDPWKSVEEQLLAIDEDFWVSSKGTDYSIVPRVNLSSCIRNFSCEPASMEGKPRRDLYKNHNQTPIFEYKNIY